MIIQEYFTLNEQEVVRTYSDAGVKIHGGHPDGYYDDALDLVSSGRTYTETDIPIESDETADKAEAYDILMGVTE